MTPRFFATPADFRSWLAKNHTRVDELWVGFHKKATGKPSITWPEAVDQALCFGWIDGLRKTIDGEAYMIRFAPRRAKSIWSAVNLKRFDALRSRGLVAPAGLEAFERRDPAKTNRYSFENRPEKMDEKYEKKLRANREAWKFFSAQPPGYQRTVRWWVISAQKEETRLKRLQTLIELSANGERLPQLTRKK